jgi:endonuclease-3
MIKRIGMYRTKARNVLSLAKIIRDQYGGKVPGDYEKLVQLPGVGKKDGKRGFSQWIRRTEDRRRYSRVSGCEPNRSCGGAGCLKTELSLMKVLPKEKWTRMHHALIWHGRRVCDARRPRCGDCGLNGLCLYFIGKNKGYLRIAASSSL